MSLKFTIPLPITDNDAYVPIRKGVRLSTKARRFKVEVASIVSSIALTNPDFEILDNVEYALTLVIYLPRVYSETWPKRAKNKFIKVDSQNRTKLPIDAVLEAIGIDDSCLFQKNIIKQQDPNNPRIEVELSRWIWD